MLKSIGIALGVAAFVGAWVIALLNYSEVTQRTSAAPGTDQLYVLLQSVRWPAERMDDTTRRVHICLLNPGDSSPRVFALADREINQRTILVRPISHATLVDGCHVLFVEGGITDVERYLTNNPKTYGLLTVGTESAFAEKGGMAALVDGDRGTQVAINPHAVQSAGLEMAPNMLQRLDTVTVR